MVTGTIFDIKRYAIQDGPGIRTTVFLKGCPLNCWWCHNPEGICPDVETRERRAVNGNGESRPETIGRVVSVSELLAEIERDVIFHDQSGGGVSFSGGEPLMQPEFLREMLAACREREIHTAVDTSGYAEPEVFESVLDLVDLFLFDLKVMDEALHLEYTGVSNRCILENLRRLDEIGKNVILRFPVIPRLTLTSKNIAEMENFLKASRSLRRLSLLPYHGTAEGKYRRWGLTNPMAGVKSPSTEEMMELRARFEQLGLEVSIGG
jgi:pyruvate formate lyase activating enzyme